MTDASIDDLAAIAATWDDDQFASKIVELLILDKGVVNAWDRTIKIMIKVARKRDVILAKPAAT